MKTNGRKGKKRRKAESYCMITHMKGMITHVKGRVYRLRKRLIERQSKKEEEEEKEETHIMLNAM